METCWSPIADSAFCIAFYILLKNATSIKHYALRRPRSRSQYRLPGHRSANANWNISKNLITIKGHKCDHSHESYAPQSFIQSLLLRCIIQESSSMCISSSPRLSNASSRESLLTFLPLEFRMTTGPACHVCGFLPVALQVLWMQVCFRLTCRDSFCLPPTQTLIPSSFELAFYGRSVTLLRKFCSMRRYIEGFYRLILEFFICCHWVAGFKTNWKLSLISICRGLVSFFRLVISSA